jgi:cellobiose phosphorylase
MGGGDWNDGMNEVGIEGSGESVWLAWFLYTVMNDFIPICLIQKDLDFAKELEEKKLEIQASIEEHAWDGEWYLRAFYDDGTKLGSKENNECRIDSISQSWSVISKAAPKERVTKALESAKKYLVNEKDGISLLLAPPFDKTLKNPGYIKNYFPGVRENGGQYTHAAVWLAIANAMVGDYNQAYMLFTMLNPIHATSNKKDALKYEKEPYAMIADISLNAPYSGRGGWSWYTGSAGWMYQGLVKWFLGIRKEADFLILEPATPPSFGNYVVNYQYGHTYYRIEIYQRTVMDDAIRKLIVDDIEMEGNKVKLVDDYDNHLIHLQL